jgi:hypothetical protein
MSNTVKGLLNDLIDDIADLEVSVQNSTGDATEATSVLIKTETDKLPALIITCEHADEEATEVAKHFHSNECWFGKLAVPVPGVNESDKDSLTPFVVDSGSNSFGTAICVLGTLDTPCTVGMTKFDLHRILITDTERTGEPYIIRVTYGDTEAEGITAGHSTSTMIYATANAFSVPLHIQMRRISAGQKVWVNCKCASNTGTITFFIGFHEYLV